MSTAPSSIQETFTLLREHLPGFGALRRAAAWPGPLGKLLARGRLSGLVDDGAGAEDAFAALRLLQRDDRAFCNAVQLEGWHLAADEERVVFQLLDDGGLLWPVGLRAVVLFGGAEFKPGVRKQVQPPGTDLGSEGPRFLVLTQAQARTQGTFRVTLRRVTS